MKPVIRWISLSLLLIAALSAYAYGSATSALVFIILGMLLEGTFWITRYKTLLNYDITLFQNMNLFGFECHRSLHPLSKSKLLGKMQRDFSVKL
mgnify:CR=1 FL=1